MTKRDRPIKTVSKTRILVVDDHPIVREQLIHLIKREPDLTVCGQADDGPIALQTVEAEAPNLVILDLSLATTDGMDLIKSIKALHPKLPILVLSMHDESLYAERVLRAGARGYITKQEATHKVTVAIRRVLDGDVYLSDRMSAQLLNKIGAAPVALPLDTLSDRELEIFRRIGRGQGTREIAHSLRLSIKTVECYRARIKRKLHITTPAGLVQRAVSWVEDAGRHNRKRPSRVE